MARGASRREGGAAPPRRGPGEQAGTRSAGLAEARLSVGDVRIGVRPELQKLGQTLKGNRRRLLPVAAEKAAPLRLGGEGKATPPPSIPHSRPRSLNPPVAA